MIAAPKISTPALLALARGQDCTVRLPHCNHDSQTVVGAHVRLAHQAGMGQKPCALALVYACSSCHDVIDGRVMLPGLTKLELHQHILLALCRTLAIVAKHFCL